MKKAWLVSLVAIFGGISLALVQNKISPIMPILMSEFNISMNTAGLLSTIFAFMGMIIAIPAAFILKSLGVKKAGLLSLTFAIVGSIIGIVAKDITILIISRVIEGTGVGIIAVLTPALISMWFPVEKRGLPMGIWGAWMMISQTVLFLASAPLTQKFGWQSMWWIGLISCTLSVVLFILFVSEPNHQDNHAISNEEENNVSIAQGIKNKSSWVMGVCAFIFTFCSFTFVSWIGLYWSEVSNWPMSTTSKWISLLYFVAIIYSVIIGFILNKTKNRKRLLIIAFIFYGIAGFCAFSVPSQIFIIVMVFIFPIFDGMVPAVLWTITPQTAKSPMFIGISLGILNIGLNCGILLSAPVSGLIIDNYGWSAVKFLFLFVACLGAVVTSRVKLNS